MTEPLIDRDFLAEVIENSVDPRGIDWNEVAADEVIAYLRSVLTPEALSPFEKHTDGSLGSKDEGEEEYDVGWLTNGVNLHRRIFGEDK